MRRSVALLLTVALLIGGGASPTPFGGAGPAADATAPGDASRATLSPTPFHGIEAVVPAAATSVHLGAADNRGPTGRLGPRAPTSWVTAHETQGAQRATPVLLRVAQTRHRSVSARLALARTGLLSRRSTAPPSVSAA